MKKLLLIVCLVIVGCSADPVKKETTFNGWQVEQCFDKDGYTVYRFSDGVNGWRYYVVPQGEVIDNFPRGKSTISDGTKTIRK